MIKLKTLLVEQENKYPEDAPEHFGGGENIDIFGYQTKHFDICKSAVTLYEKLKQNEEAKDLCIEGDCMTGYGVFRLSNGNTIECDKFENNFVFTL